MHASLSPRLSCCPPTTLQRALTQSVLWLRRYILWAFAHYGLAYKQALSAVGTDTSSTAGGNILLKCPFTAPQHRLQQKQASCAVMQERTSNQLQVPDKTAICQCSLSSAAFCDTCTGRMSMLASTSMPGASSKSLRKAVPEPNCSSWEDLRSNRGAPFCSRRPKGAPPAAAVAMQVHLQPPPAQ